MKIDKKSGGHYIHFVLFFCTNVMNFMAINPIGIYLSNKQKCRKGVAVSTIWIIE